LASPSKHLSELCAAAWQERHSGFRGSIQRFIEASADAELLAHARAEHARLVQLERNIGCLLEQRCYASAHQLKFLHAALAEVKTDAA
jgi:hypothetical protein